MFFFSFPNESTFDDSQRYEEVSEKQKENLFFFSFPNESTFDDSQRYEEVSEKQKKKAIIFEFLLSSMNKEGNVAVFGFLRQLRTTF